MPQLHVLQSIWGMDRLRINQGKEWSIEERLTRIHAAGFDGISAHFYDETDIESWIDQSNEYGFVIEGCAFPTSIEDLRPALALAAKHQIHHIAIQGDVRPYSTKEAVEILAGWQTLSAEYGVPIVLETHRNTITNDLWNTREMLDSVAIPLLADISHYISGQEIHIPPTPRNAELIDRMLRHAKAFHGRVSTSEQIQVEISFDCYRPWLDQFLNWWEQGFRYWLAEAKPEDSLTFTCELGPAPYAIIEPDGQDRSDRWAEAQMLMQLVRVRWNIANC